MQIYHTAIIQLKDAALKISQVTSISVSPSPQTMRWSVSQCLQADGKRPREHTAGLKESEEQSRTILDTASDAFIGMDQQGLLRIGIARRGHLRCPTRSDRASLKQNGDPSTIPNSHLTGLQRFLTTHRSGAEHACRTHRLHREGREFPVELTIWPLQRGQTYLFNAFIRDITSVNRRRR